MKTLTYSEKLKNPLWQKKRLLIFERDNWACQSCGEKTINLQVHHLKYFAGLEPWEYQDHFLITYCEVCHQTEHLIGKEIRESLLEIINADRIYIKPLAQLCNLIEGFDGFYPLLKNFLNDCQIEFLKTKRGNAA